MPRMPARHRRRLRHAQRPRPRRAGLRRRRARHRGPRLRARRHRHARCRRAARRCRPSGRCRCRSDYVDVLKTAVPEAVARRGHRPGIRHRHRAPTSPPARRCRSPPTARRSASCPSSPTARTPTSSSGSTTPRSARPTASTRVARERGETLAAALRRLHLERVGVRQGPAAARGGPRALRPHGPLGRGRRLDRLAAQRPLRAQRLHRRLQGHPTRTAPTRAAEFLARAQPRLRRLRRDQARARDRPPRRRRRHA